MMNRVSMAIWMNKENTYNIDRGRAKSGRGSNVDIVASRLNLDLGGTVNSTSRESLTRLICTHNHTSKDTKQQVLCS